MRKDDPTTIVSDTQVIDQSLFSPLNNSSSSLKVYTPLTNLISTTPQETNEADYLKCKITFEDINNKNCDDTIFTCGPSKNFIREIPFHLM
jgi:hypothetical protein